jgi:hypothetical protein
MWDADGLLILAKVLVTCDLYSFRTRRMLQRMERAEITPLQAAKIIVEQPLCAQKRPVK